MKRVLIVDDIQGEFLQRHNKALSRKLETKLKDVERLHRDLSNEIAERRKLEEKLTWYETRFFDILDATPLAMVFMRKTGEVLHVNKQFAHLFGYCREELQDFQTRFEIAYPDDSLRALMLRLWQNAPHVDGLT
jgi:PAS domain-containing protein